MEEQKTKSKMALFLPLVMYLPGRKDKSVVHEKKKMGPEIHPGLSGSHCYSGRDARGAKNNAGLVRWWQARREAEDGI